MIKESKKVISNTKWAVIDGKYTEDFEWPEDAERVLKKLGWYEKELAKKNGRE